MIKWSFFVLLTFFLLFSPSFHFVNESRNERMTQFCTLSWRIWKGKKWQLINRTAIVSLRLGARLANNKSNSWAPRPSRHFHSFNSIHSLREKSFFPKPYCCNLFSLYLAFLCLCLYHSNLNKYYTRKRDLRKALFSLLFYIFLFFHFFFFSFAQETKSILQFLDFWITFIVLLRVKKKKMKISSQRSRFEVIVA